MKNTIQTFYWRGRQLKENRNIERIKVQERKIYFLKGGPAYFSAKQYQFVLLMSKEHPRKCVQVCETIVECFKAIANHSKNILQLL